MLNIKSALIIALVSSAFILTACSKKEPAQTTETPASEVAVSEPAAISGEQPVSDAEVAPVEPVPAEQTEAIASLDKPSN
ncbi:hypothetical protein EC844_1422 [Acinetobacter calcoaceticus]|uniref:Lipoprotein n=1 Tax=Acinetobacter calcoaceticus TaxID=471 RepID=A0A4R1XAP5_ACICA|nr:hypothetical protein EC844_1422 [Acinetobacter calcoaceticus]